MQNKPVDSKQERQCSNSLLATRKVVHWAKSATQHMITSRKLTQQDCTATAARQQLSSSVLTQTQLPTFSLEQYSCSQFQQGKAPARKPRKGDQQAVSWDKSNCELQAKMCKLNKLLKLTQKKQEQEICNRLVPSINRRWRLWTTTSPFTERTLHMTGTSYWPANPISASA